MDNYNSAKQGNDRDSERNLRIAVGKRIEVLRKRKRWIQADLARRVGVERTTLLRWEKGSLPSLGMLILLSEVLETTLDALLAGRTPDPMDLTPDQKKAAVVHLNQLASLLRLQVKR
ncbi:MAG TPA: helix-turn-helix transcriptional regulator [Thermoanaerobaculia bacterium]|nr:helix-turn-helix transcriptional regulator [Thermoanaerobaculia bacterium]